MTESFETPFEVRDILVHWTEIGLKGRNRPQFIDRLAHNIRRAVRGLPVYDVRKLPGRLWITVQDGHTFDGEIIERLQTVYGIANFCPAIHTPLDLEAMKEAAWTVAQNQTYEPFRISSRRAFKDLPFGSQDTNIALGDYVYGNRPAKVKMKGADLDIRVEMVPQGAFIYADKIPGLGGLPQGMTGKVCALLSGGIDSPVAAFRLMRRGCRAVFVHFHGHPYVTRASLEKAEDMAAHLARYQYDATLYAVAFGEFQSHIVDTAPPKLRVVLYRRFMVRVAALIARREKCRALVTGEALAQVASQTLSNMVVIDEASSMPILRPLVGYDKYEIETEAKALGTYEISILPDQDCCTLFTPRHPETHAKMPQVRAAEEPIDIDDWVTKLADSAERIDVRAPWWDEKPRSRKKGAHNQPESSP